MQSYNDVYMYRLSQTVSSDGWSVSTNEHAYAASEKNNKYSDTPLLSRSFANLSQPPAPKIFAFPSHAHTALTL